MNIQELHNLLDAMENAGFNQRERNSERMRAIAKRLLTAHNAEPKGLTNWRERCAVIVDIYDDAKNNAPEDRCYVDGSFNQEIDELRALLAKGE